MRLYTWLKQGFCHFYSHKLIYTTQMGGYAIEDWIPFQDTFEWPFYSTLENVYKAASVYEDLRNKTYISELMETGFTFPHRRLHTMYKICDEYSGNYNFQSLDYPGFPS